MLRERQDKEDQSGQVRHGERYGRLSLDGDLHVPSVNLAGQLGKERTQH